MKILKQNHESFRHGKIESREKRYSVSEAINMLSEPNSDSSDNSITYTIKEWQRVAYEVDKIDTLLIFVALTEGISIFVRACY